MERFYSRIYPRRPKKDLPNNLVTAEEFSQRRLQKEEKKLDKKSSFVFWEISARMAILQAMRKLPGEEREALLDLEAQAKIEMGIKRYYQEKVIIGEGVVGWVIANYFRKSFNR